MVPTRIMPPPNQRMLMTVPYMTNCMAAIFVMASLNARSDWVWRFVFTSPNFWISYSPLT